MCLLADAIATVSGASKSNKAKAGTAITGTRIAITATGSRGTTASQETTASKATAGVNLLLTACMLGLLGYLLGYLLGCLLGLLAWLACYCFHASLLQLLIVLFSPPKKGFRGDKEGLSQAKYVQFNPWFLLFL